MAGSLVWKNYQSDDGTDWAIFVDESNYEAANGAAGAAPDPTQLYKPPRNLRPRFAVYGNTDGTRTISVPINTQATYNALDRTSTIPDVLAGGSATLFLVRKRAEQIGPIPTAADTGLDDGDSP